MEVSLIKGKNFRNYLKIEKAETLDELKALEKIVTRTEYKPFVKSFNKSVTNSYFIDQTYIPLQFLDEITRNFAPYYDFKITNPEKIPEFYNTNIHRTQFDALIKKIILPPKYDIFKEEYSYQPDSVFKALVTKVARIKIGTGGGKTLITYLYCKFLIRHILNDDREAKKILIIVPKKDLVKQTVSAFKEFNEYNEPLIVESVYGGSKRIANAEVVIGTYQSLCNNDTDYFDDFFAMIGDEAHTTKAYSIREEIYNKCRFVEYMFAMTATYPEENKLDYLNIVAMFGPLVHEKTLKQLINDGNICDILINRILINYKSPDMQGYQYINKKLKADNEFLEDSEKLTPTEIYRTERKIVQSIIPRIDLMRKLCSIPNNHLILVENREYLDLIFSELYMNFQDKKIIKIHGDVKNREEIFAMMEEEKNIICIATYDTFSTGVSVNNIHFIHFPDGGKSMFRVLQGLGRGVRLHKLKKLLHVFDYVDVIPNSSYAKHAAERLKIYQKEQLKTQDKKVYI